MQIRLAAGPAVFLCATMACMGVVNANTSALDAVVEKAALTAAETKTEAVAEDEDAAAEEGAAAAAAETETEIDSEVKSSREAAAPPAEDTVSESQPYGSLISRYAAEHGISEGLARAVVRVESNFRANATGAAGEIGLMQLKLSTARMMGYSGGAKALYDPETNIRYGMKYLAKAQRLGGGSLCQTILRYNAGHGATRMNPVSANYCNKVAAMLQ